MTLAVLEEFARKQEEERKSGVFAKAAELAPELDFDTIWAPIPDISLVIPAFGICPGPAHLVAGSWYTGKTLFLLAAGIAVASGRDLFGVHRTKQGNWIHFDHEMGLRSCQRYMQRVRAGVGVDPEEMRGRVSLRILPRLNLTHPEAVDLYCSLLEGRDLCTIDPLRAAAPGQNENDSEYRQWVDLINTVSNKTGCAVVLLHHGGKPTDGIQRRNTGRGTSAIDDAVQSKFVLTAKEKGAPIHVSHEKTRELANPIGDFWLRIENDHEAVRLVHLDAEQIVELEAVTEREKEEARLAKACAAIRTTMATFAGRFHGNREEFLRLVEGDRNVTSKAFTAMKAKGEMVVGGKRGEVVISLSV